MRSPKHLWLSGAAAALLASAGTAYAQDQIFVGHLLDYTGATSFVGKLYGPGVSDAIKYINEVEGGIDGTPITLESVDYGYQVPQALSLYEQWKAKGMVAMQGWGTADTEALISFVANDKIPVWSASYSAHLTDPTGKNPETKTPAPYNFFYGPSYSDGCRALAQWAAEDAKANGIENPKFLHTGDNHPYPNSPKEGCARYAAELGLEVLEPIVVPLAPGDFKPQCLSIQNTGAQYTYVGNLGGSVVAMLNSCETVGVETTFMANMWAGDEQTIEAANAQNYVFLSATPFWGDVPEDSVARQIFEYAGGEGTPTHHYLRGICSAYYMKEAMEMAKAKGEITGEAIRDAMYEKTDWVPEGLEGVCQPSTWTREDHRGTTIVNINRGSFVDGTVQIEKLAEINLPRRDDWLGK